MFSDMIFLRKKFNQNQTAVLIQRLGLGRIWKRLRCLHFSGCLFLTSGETCRFGLRPKSEKRRQRCDFHTLKTVFKEWETIG